MTTTNNGMNLQIAPKNNTKGCTLITGTANDGTTYSLNVWVFSESNIYYSSKSISKSKGFMTK